MSLFELGRSTGNISLRDTLKGVPARSLAAELSARTLAELICIGGWPEYRLSPPNQAQRANWNHVQDICRADLQRVDGIRRDPDRVLRLLRSLARNVATCASLATIVRDAAGPGGSLGDETARGYLAALERLMVVEDQPPWSPRLRSRSRLRRSHKRHFVDPSLAVAALRAGPQHLLRDFEWFGFLFESLVLRDLRVYAQAMDADVFHYRDNTGLEVDAIVDAGRIGGPRSRSSWGRAGSTMLRAACSSSWTGSTRNAAGEPAALGVIVGTGYGYTRRDGVAVILSVRSVPDASAAVLTPCLLTAEATRVRLRNR